VPSLRRPVRAVLIGLAAVPLVLDVVAGHALTAPVASVATFTRNVRADAAEKDAGQNEPQVVVDQTGAAYVAWQGSTGKGKTAVSRTTDGLHFTYLGNPDPGFADVGDTALATTSWTSPTQTVPVGPAGSQAVLYSVLGGTQSPTCPMGKVFNIRASYSEDGGQTWNATDATCQPAQIDRNWIAAYTEPKYRGTLDARAHTWVYQEYHDFAISMVWVSVSSDGGTTWDTLGQHPAEQPGGALIANACNVTPGGIAVDQRGAHPGRVYVAWTTSDTNHNAQGCNITEAEPFDHVYVSYSDDHGSTWTTHAAWNDPCAPNPPVPPANPLSCSDDQEIFTPIAIDDAGNAYVAFVDMPDSHTAPAAPQFDVAVAWSTDGGDSWSGGAVDSPGKPRIATSDAGTHYFPWLTAAGNGAVDVVWYGTPYVQGLSQMQKPAPAPDSAVWNVYMGQSLDVIHGAPFVQSKVSDHAMYFGDICTVGIFCDRTLGPSVLGSGGDRILLDDFGVAIGPDGGARVAWTDARDSWTGTCQPGAGDNSTTTCQKTHLYFACQTSGTGLHGELVIGCGQSVPAVTTVSPGTTAGTTMSGGAGTPASGGSTASAPQPASLPNTAAAAGAPSAAGLAALLLTSAAALARRRSPAATRPPDS
jgi:hypothetical protein